MLNPVGRASPTIVTPLLRANDTNAAQSNLAQINGVLASARRMRVPLTIQLPTGVFFIGDGTQAIFALTESHAGVTIEGMGVGKTVFVPASDVSVLPLSLLSTRVSYSSSGTLNPTLATITEIPSAEIGDYNVDDVIYIWALNSSNARSVSYRRTILNVNVGGTSIDLNSSFPSLTGGLFKHVKGVALSGEIAAGANTVTLPSSGLASRLTVGDDVLIGDGPALNNFYSEWARVAGISGTTVYLDRRLRRTYAPSGSGRDACIVPGPHMTDITIRNLSIAVPDPEAAVPLATLRFGFRTRLENVEFVPLPNGTMRNLSVDVVNCGEVELAGVSGLSTLTFHASQDVQQQGGLVPGIVAREYCSDLLFDGLTTHGPDGFQCASASGPGPCERIHLVNSRVTNHGDGSSASNVNFVAGSVISNVQIVQPNNDTPPAIELEDDNLTLTSVTSESEISVAGEDQRIDKLTAPHLTLEDGSSGVLLTPLLPEADEVEDMATPGAWRTPLPTRIDGKVAGTEATDVSLQVIAVASQTADLQQWQDSSGSVLFRVNKDGYMISHKTSVPDSADLQNNEFTFWLDTSGTPIVLRIKAKTGLGSVVTGGVNLS